MARKQKKGAVRSWSPLGKVQNVSRRDTTVVVECEEQRALWIDFPLPGVARVRLAVDDRPLTGASGMVLRQRAEVRGAVDERRGRITLRAPGIEVSVHAENAGLEFRDSEGRSFLGAAEDGGHAVKLPKVRLTRPRVAGERIYGLGEKAWGLERSGRAWRMWNTDCHRYHRGTDPTYKSVPFLLISRPASGLGNTAGLGNTGRFYYGVFFDNPYALRVDLKERDAWTVEADGGPLEYHVVAGPTPADVLERFTALTGRPPLPPRWALGYHQSRWSYAPERRVRKLADEFRARDVPCDAIHLDIDHTDGFRPFTWNKKRFPDPARLARDLKSQGIRLVTIVNPGIKVEKNALTNAGLKQNHFLRHAGGKPVVAKVWPGRCYFPDYSRIATQRWWGENFADPVKHGVAGTWIDMNEPSVFADERTLASEVKHYGAPGRRDHAGNHNLYGTHMAEATYKALAKQRPDARPFVLTRAAFAGAQRYAAVWTGDNHSTWRDLELMPPMLLGLGVSGLPFCGADVGGFHGTPTAELFTRWVQAAALTPLFRAHTERETHDQEPWSYGPAAEERVRAAIRLRYRLMPFLYTLFEAASRSGAPIMRPLWWTFPDDPRAQQIDDQFLLGDDLLVAPVLHRGATSRMVYFPEGLWQALDSEAVVQGPITRRIKAPMDRLPVYLRGGAIVPAREPAAYTDAAPLDPLELLVFPGLEQTARGVLYEDDGDGFDYRRGRYRRTTITARREADRIVVQAKFEGNLKRPQRDVVVTLAGPDADRDVTQVRIVDRGNGWRAGVLL